LFAAIGEEVMWKCSSLYQILCAVEWFEANVGHVQLFIVAAFQLQYLLVITEHFL